MLQALEFDRIVEAVQGLALTPLGRTRLRALRPQFDPRRVAALQAATTEGVRYLEAEGEFPLEAPADLESILAALATEGRPLEPLRLRALATFVDSVELARAAVQRAAAQLPILHALTEGLASFKNEVADVRERIDPTGEVVDQASPDLRAIRDRLRKQRARLRSTLESFLRGKDTARYLQDQIVTDRNGRYVLVVRAEHRTAIPGIIHGSSSSGASLFLEPLSTVEVNNDIVALEEQEAAEVRRILLALTDAFRRRPLELQRLIEVGTELDAIQARARLSRLLGGVEPILDTEGGIELRSARHPLLIPALVEVLGDGGVVAENGSGEAGARQRQKVASDPVPVDIILSPPATVLIITGPNTGGKTVALKTMGLLALMAQAGLHVPAAPGSKLPIFRSVFADIGDEQSIAESLSTFSWHITNIAAMDRGLVLPSLVLLDEIGAGTDPTEGGALGQAIIEHFRSRGAAVVATTHSDAIKSYASTTEGVVSAAFGFDPSTFAPTYRLTYGSPGRSLALEMAGRLGLNPAIVDRARQNLTEREAQLAEHLARIDQDLHALEHERRLVAREHEMLADAEARLRVREEALKQREEAARRKLDDQIEERLRQARREIDRVVDELRKRVEELAAQAERRAAHHGPLMSTGEVGAARTEARLALDSVIDRIREASEGPRESAPAGTPDVRPAVGDRVILTGLGLEGVLVAIHDTEGEVDVQGKRLRARLADLRVVARKSEQAPSRVNVNVQLLPRDTPETDLNVIGCTVEDALARVERFLDETLISEQRSVRIIHGHGTGQLRRAVAQFLQGHPLVTRFDSAAPDEGGTGVTVVELKE